MLLVADRNDLHSFVRFNGIENPESIELEFPRSNGIGAERFLPPGSGFCVRVQVSNDPGYNDPLLLSFKMSNVPLGTVCERDPILHSSMVSEKGQPLKLPADRVEMPTARKAITVVTARVLSSLLDAALLTNYAAPCARGLTSRTRYSGRETNCVLGPPYPAQPHPHGSPRSSWDE